MVNVSRAQYEWVSDKKGQVMAPTVLTVSLLSSKKFGRMPPITSESINRTSTGRRQAGEPRHFHLHYDPVLDALYVAMGRHAVTILVKEIRIEGSQMWWDPRLQFSGLVARTAESSWKLMVQLPDRQLLLTLVWDGRWTVTKLVTPDKWESDAAKPGGS